MAPHVELGLDGRFSVEVEVTNIPIQSPQHIDLLQLMSNALEPAMLDDEPELIDHLSNLRKMLSSALNLIDRTLASLNSQES